MGLSQTRVIPNVLGCSAPHLAFPRFCRLPKNGCGITSVYHLASPPHRPTQSTKFRTRWLESHPSARNFLLHTSCVNPPKRAFPPTVTLRVCKTSVSYETSSKKSCVQSPKRAFRTRLPPKVKRKHPSEHTHQAAVPSSFAIPAPPQNARSRANPIVTATCTNSQPHDCLRLPRNFLFSHV